MATASANKGEEALEDAAKCREAGNDLLNKGDYADACTQYDQGLVALARAGDANKSRETELRLALHLNSSLAHLRRGNLSSATSHATGALAIDGKSEKGFFRRASARVRLSEHPGHEADAKLALEDFEKVFELNPDNTEAAKQIRLLRIQLKREQKDFAKTQKETYKNIFSGGKQLYEDAPAEHQRAAPVVREGGVTDDAAHKPLLAVEQLAFHYVSGEPVLEDVNFELRATSCMGLFGNNASGKSTLARILCGQLAPAAGKVTHCDSAGSALAVGSSSALISMAVPPAVAALAILVGAAVRVSAGQQPLDAATSVVKSMSWIHWTVLTICTVVVAVCVRVFLNSRNVKRAKHSVLHVSSESSDKEEIPGRWTIEKMIGEKLQGSLSPDERRRRVIAMLKASGFAMYNQDTGEVVGSPEEYVKDGLTYGCLSGGQKHLMYVLRCIAAAPDALICDEVLGGLDAFRQPRVLHMLRRMKEELGTAVLYITCELSQMRLVCDSIGFLSGGVLSELGPAGEVLDCPKHPDTKDYVNSYRGLPGCHIIGGKLAEAFAALKGDPDIEGNWLPV